MVSWTPKLIRPRLPQKTARALLSSGPSAEQGADVVVEEDGGDVVAGRMQVRSCIVTEETVQ